MFELVLVVIIIALIFDFLNGFHDSANSIATIVSTGVLSPQKAVMFAAFFNFAAAFAFGEAVAKTVGSGLVKLDSVDIYVILAGLLGAIFWNIFTWYYGIPVSSSHALIGGYGGAAIAKLGWDVIIWAGFERVVLFIFLAPVMGFILGLINMLVTSWIVRNKKPRAVDSVFRKLQLVSAAFYSFGHGSNDAQKTMGIIVSVMVAAKFQDEFYVPIWVVMACHLAIGLGTLFGGWRIVKTMGMKITKLKPIGGFCAEFSGATTLLMTALFGIPVSTTQTITGSILGVGSVKRLSAVKWGVAGKIVWAWVLTIPLSGLVGALCYYAVSLFV
ncbi:MAG TPA: inorganic phosphate transporter, partial [Ignavibacteria bacterium]|nr:inorganic phosphate transporter [Ignavibacteria bacterium]